MADRPDIRTILDNLTPRQLAALTRKDFAIFLGRTYPIVGGGAALVPAAYLNLIAALLADVTFGRVQNLIITLPPRHLKSICVSVMLPAFFLGHHPDAEVMCVSYGQDLAHKFGEDTRKVMLSPLYLSLFQTRLISPRASASLLRTVQGGVRRATSIDGVATGVGADLLIFDDPQKPGETLSEKARTSANQAFETTFLSRRNDPAKSRIVVVMQRLHEDDFVGHVQTMGIDWVVVNLPAVAETAEAIPYRTFRGDHVFRRREGQALHPRRIPRAELDRIRDQVGPMAWAAQYQQRPAPAGGGLVKLEWLQPYEPKDLPETFERVVQSWDTANTTREWSDYSVCTTWGVYKNRYYLRHVLRERLNYPDLKARLLQLAKTWNANVVLVENHASGVQLLQELPKLGFYNTRGVKPDRDKAMRMSNQTGAMSAGAVLIPKEAPWLTELLNELAMFPNSRHDDQVDSISQALAFMTHGRPTFEDWMEIMQERIRMSEQTRERELRWSGE